MGVAILQLLAILALLTPLVVWFVVEFRSYLSWCRRLDRMNEIDG